MFLVQSAVTVSIDRTEALLEPQITVLTPCTEVPECLRLENIALSAPPRSNSSAATVSRGLMGQEVIPADNQDNF